MRRRAARARYRPRSDPAGDKNYAPLWKANTAYLAGQAALLPNGKTGTAKADFTSGSAFVEANWNIAAGSGLAKAEADTLYSARKPITMQDIGRSWWQSAGAMFDATARRVSIGGITRGGQMVVGTAELDTGNVKINPVCSDRFLLDDHCGMGFAMDFENSRRAIVAFSRHDRNEPYGSSVLHVRESDAYNNFDNLGPDQHLSFGAGTQISYGSVLVKPTAASKVITSTAGSAVLTCTTTALAATPHLLVDGMRVRFTGAPRPRSWLAPRTTSWTRRGSEHFRIGGHPRRCPHRGH